MGLELQEAEVLYKITVFVMSKDLWIDVAVNIF